MQDISYSNALYQVSEILNYIEDSIKDRIPMKFINYMELNKSKHYKWKVDTSVPLEKQELLQTTKEILTVLYRDYICNDVERATLDKILNENETKYQNILREKYNPDNLFKNKKKSVEVKQIKNENTALTIYKESFFSKILSKIKLIFHIKK